MIPDLSKPQSWNRFSYVYNNPILHNDPTGHCPMCVTAAIGGILGAAIGAASVALPQMIKNAQAGQPLTTNIDPAEVGKAAAAGAVAGVIGGLTFGIGTAVMGSGLGATMVAGAVSGALAGQASRATNNVLSGRNVGTGLFNPKDMAVDAVVGGAMAGVGWGIGKYVSSLKGGCSFTKDTTVAIKDGKKAIGSIVIGDYVLAWNEADGTLDYYPVTAVLVHEDEVLTELVIDGEWIETTPEHPFYSEEEGWVSADELKTGMHVRQADGDYELVWLKWNIHKIQEMYNLTVDTAHTFFVGDGQWLVHNNTCPTYDRSAFGEIDPDVRSAVFKRDNYTCAYCGERGGDLTVDHVYPLKKAWQDGMWRLSDAQRNSWMNNMDNLITSCRSCNSSKNSSYLSDWINGWE